MVLLFITLLLPFILSAADEQNAQPHHIMITAHNESAKLPLHVARLSSFMRDYMEQPIFANTHVIPLDFPDQASRDASDLELLVSFVTTAEETLIAKSTSSQGSYVQLAYKALAPFKDPKQLLKLFIACDFLQFDFNQSKDFDHGAIKKAIAYHIARKNLLSSIDAAGEALQYNTEDFVSPYVQAQSYLIAKKIPIDGNFSITLRDMMVHDALNDRFVVKEWNSVNLFWYLQNMHLNSMQGIMNLKAVEYLTHLNLENNQLTELPDDLEFPNLINLDLSQNRLKQLPIFSAPALEELDASHNKLTNYPTLYLPKLFNLKLQSNNLTTIANIHSLPELMSLDVSDNNITTLPADVSNMPMLGIIYAANNPIIRIPDTIKNFLVTTK